MWIVLVFVAGLLVVFAGGYQLAKKKALAPKKKPEAIDSDFACEALVTRVFEQRLVEVGIMTVEEMSTCDSPACKDCLPTHQAINKVSKTRELKKPPPGGGAAPKAKNPPLVVGGQNIPWPEKVPQHAVVEVVHPTNTYGNYIVNWLWIDPKTARQMRYSVKIADMSRFSDLFPTFTGVGGEKPVSQWSPPTHAGSDPVRRPMAGKSRADAIAELRKNPPKPPKGKGGGSPMTPERRREAVRSLTRRR